MNQKAQAWSVLLGSERDEDGEARCAGGRMQPERGQSLFDKYLVGDLGQPSQENCRSCAQATVKESVARVQERKEQKREPV